MKYFVQFALSAKSPAYVAGGIRERPSGRAAEPPYSGEAREGIRELLQLDSSSVLSRLRHSRSAALRPRQKHSRAKSRQLRRLRKAMCFECFLVDLRNLCGGLRLNRQTSLHRKQRILGSLCGLRRQIV